MAAHSPWQAREWMIESVLRGELLSHAQASGWMADFGEALPCEGIALHDGREACNYHNQYPVLEKRRFWKSTELLSLIHI